MHFDYYTVTVMIAALFFIQFSFMGILWFTSRPRRSDLALWALAYTVLGIAAFLVFLRGDPPNPVILLLSNFLLCAYFPILEFGLAGFDGRRWDMRLPIAFMSLTTLCFAYFTLIRPWTMGRFVVYNAAVILYSAVLARTLSRTSHLEPRTIPSLVAFFFVFLSLLHVLRLALGLRLGLPRNIMAGGTWDPVIQALAEAIVLGVGFGLILFHSARLNAQVAEAAGQKEILLREMAHRTKNDLALVDGLIGLERGMIADPEIGARLDALRDRIVAMSRAHERLSQARDPGALRLDEYLSVVAEGLPRRLSVHIELDLDEIEVPFAMAVPMGLILNELATNALKHAFPEEGSGLLRIRLKAAEGQVILEVGDDGVGMDWPPASPGLGTVIVQSMAEKIGARLSYRRAGGSSFVLDCPLPFGD
ncbi:MAG: sensor histidine kinase [Rectinemataceae bacterium]